MQFADIYDILISEGKRNPENKKTKEVIKMKKEMKKLLMAYIEKYNGMIADLEIDEILGVDIKYDKGKKYVLSDIVYDLASVLDIELNMDIKGYIKIAE